MAGMRPTHLTRAEVEDEAGRIWYIRSGDPGWYAVYYMWKLGYSWFVLPSVVLAGAIPTGKHLTPSLRTQLGEPMGRAAREQYQAIWNELSNLEV